MSVMFGCSPPGLGTGYAASVGGVTGTMAKAKGKDKQQKQCGTWEIKWKQGNLLNYLVQTMGKGRQSAA